MHKLDTPEEVDARGGRDEKDSLQRQVDLHEYIENDEHTGEIFVNKEVHVDEDEGKSGTRLVGAPVCKIQGVLFFFAYFEVL
jgi:hypothetical protein